MAASSRARVLALLAVLLLVAGPALTGAGAQTRPETDNTVTRIEVRADGSARWTVRVRTRLATQGEVDTFRAFQARFRNDTATYLDPFRQRIEGVVAGAAEATGREMRATNFTASTTVQEVPRRWGVVSYSFTWEGFAAERGDRLVVGDVFQGGLLLTGNDTLAVEPPPGYAVREVDPAPTRREDDRLAWIGQVDFADRRPRVVVAPRAETPAAGDGTDGGGLPLAALGVAGLLVAAGVGGVLAVRARRSRNRGTGAPLEPADRPPDAGPREGPEGGPDAGTDPATAGAAAEDPLLPDDERVLRLLEREGGRMRQAAVAEQLDWSASKTSRVVTGLAEDGEIEKLRIGRENVLSLAESGSGSGEPGRDG